MTDGAAREWSVALNSYSYPTELSNFADAKSLPGWFTRVIAGDRDSTIAFEDYFRERAAHHLEVWYEVAFWKMYSQAGRRDEKTREVWLNLRRAGLSAKDLWCACNDYIQHPTERLFRTFQRLLWKPGGRAIAVAATFPAFIAPNWFPMVDTRVARWVSARMDEHNAADPGGPQLVRSSYPGNSTTVLTFSDWPFVQSWIQWCRGTAEKLTQRTCVNWRARDAEMAVFMAWGQPRERKGIPKDQPVLYLPHLGAAKDITHRIIEGVDQCASGSVDLL